MQQQLCSTAQAAEILCLKPQTLRVWRWKGIGPRYIRYGKARGRVMYRVDDLEAWLESRSFASTSEETVRGSTDGA